MSTIKALCNRSILLDMGFIKYDGLTSKAVQLYLDNSTASKSFNRKLEEKETPSIVSAEVSINQNLDEKYIQLDVEVYAPKQQKLSLDIRLFDVTGTAIGFGSLGALCPSQLIEVSNGLNSVSLFFPINQLATGTYLISLDLTVPRVKFYDRLDNCLSFDVVQQPLEDHGQCLQQSWGYGSFEIPLYRKN